VLQFELAARQCDAAHGIRYTNLPGGYYLNPQVQLPDAPGVMAISASRLQGLHVHPIVRDHCQQIAQTRRPREVLGGTICLYDVP
jgi:hypothetical protein